MSISAKTGGVWHTVTNPQVRVGGAWQPVQKVYAKAGGVWQLVFNRNFIFNDVVAADMVDYNLSTRAVAAGWDGVVPLVATVTVNGGVVVGASGLGAAFTVPALPAASTVSITNNGFIVGHGGAGGMGVHAVGTPLDGGNAGNGGLALSVAYATTIVNASGTIGGGGGGSGGGGCDLGTGGGGGGGAGRNAGAGGASVGNPGSPGTYNAGGAGGAHIGSDSGDGFTGGALGVVGTDGAGSSSTNGGTHGNPGDCTSGNINITWTSTGNRWGTLN